MTEQASRVQSLDRALSILEILSNYESLSLNEISEKVGLHKATTHRLVNALLENGFIEKNRKTKQYALSMKLYQLGNRRLQYVDLTQIARELLSKLSIDWDGNFYIATARSKHVHYTNLVSDHTLKNATLETCASGLSILSTRSLEELLHYWNTTPQTIPFHVLSETILSTRKSGFAVSTHPSYIEIAVPIMTLHAPISEALCYTAPIPIADTEIEFIGLKLVQLAQRLSIQMGYVQV